MSCLIVAVLDQITTTPEDDTSTICADAITHLRVSPEAEQMMANQETVDLPHEVQRDTQGRGGIGSSTNAGRRARFHPGPKQLSYQPLAINEPPEDMCCTVRSSPAQPPMKWTHPIAVDGPEFDLARRWPVDLRERGGCRKTIGPSLT